MSSQLFELAAVRFELVDAAHNRRRFYTLHVMRERQLTIPGQELGPGWLLVVARGRIGGKPIVRQERFENPLRAVERFGELATRRRRHGYAEVRA